MLRIVDTEADSGQICTDLDRPSRIGPITVAPPSDWTNLVAIEADYMWGSHCYWMAPARAERALDEYGDIPFDELPLGTERFTVPRSGFASWLNSSYEIQPVR